MAKRVHINRKVKQVILDYIRYHKEKDIYVQKAYLFGSYAKASNKRWSDIDLCVISPQFQSENETWEILWQNRSMEDVEVMLSPIGFHPDDFIDEDPLVYEIKKSGIELEI